MPSLILTLAWYVILLHSRSSMWRLAFLCLPGTFAHEAAHFVVGFLVVAKPAHFTIWPRRSGDRWILGSVTFKGINILNGAFVALAPILFFPVAWFCLTRLEAPFWVERRWGWWLAAGYLTSTVLFSAMPSLQDVKRGRSSLIFYGIIVGLGWLIGSSVLGHRDQKARAVFLKVGLPVPEIPPFRWAQEQRGMAE